MKKSIIFLILLCICSIILIFFLNKKSDKPTYYEKEVIGTKDINAYIDLEKDSNKNFEHIYNITPKGYKNIKLFKNNDTAESYIIYDNKIRKLGNSFGGYGLMDSVLFDIDKDNKEELIFTYSFGSGLHRSLIGIFDFDTEEENTIGFELYNGDMILVIEDDKVKVYSTSLDLIDMSNYILKSKDYLGEIRYKDGEFILKS